MTICNQKKLIILLAIICTFDSLSAREQKQKIRTSNSNQHVKTPLSPKQKKTENIQVNKPQTNKKEVELNLAGLPMYETDIQSNSSPIKLEKHQVEYFRNLDQNNQENDLGDVLFRNLDKNDQKKKDEPSMGDVLFRNLEKKEEPSMGDVLFRNLSGKSQNKKDNESLGDVLFRNLSGNTNKNQDNQSLGDVLFRNLARTPRQRQGVPPKQANGMNPTKGEIHNAIKKDGIVAIQNILKQKHPNLYQDEIIDNDSKSMGSTAFFRNLESQKGPNDQPSSVTYLFRNLEKEKGPHDQPSSVTYLFRNLEKEKGPNDQPSSVTYLFRNLDKGPHEQPSSVTYLFRNLESNKNKIHRVLI